MQPNREPGPILRAVTTPWHPGRYNGTAFTACRGPWRGGPWRRPCRQPSSPLLPMQPAWPAIGAHQVQYAACCQHPVVIHLRLMLITPRHCLASLTQGDRPLAGRSCMFHHLLRLLGALLDLTERCLARRLALLWLLCTLLLDHLLRSGHTQSGVLLTSSWTR